MLSLSVQSYLGWVVSQKVSVSGKIREKTTISQYTLLNTDCLSMVQTKTVAGWWNGKFINTRPSLCHSTGLSRRSQLSKRVHRTSAKPINLTSNVTSPRVVHRPRRNPFHFITVCPPTENPPRIASKVAAVSNELIHTLFWQIDRK